MLCLAILAFTYPILIYLGYGIIAAGFLFHRAESIKFIPYLLGSLFISSVSLYHLALPFWESTSYYDDIFSMIKETKFSTRLPLSISLMAFIVVIGVLSGSRIKNSQSSKSEFLFTLLIGQAIAFTFAFLINGGFFSDRVFYRGGATIYYCASAILLHQIFTEMVKRKSISIGFFDKKLFQFEIPSIILRTLYKKSDWIWFCGILIILLATSTHRINAVAKSSNAFNDNTGIIELAEWFNTNTSSAENFITLDPDVILHLPAYTNLRTFNPARGRSQVGEKERRKRFFQTLSFFKVEPESLDTLLTTMDSHRKINEKCSMKIYQYSLCQESCPNYLHKTLSLAIQ